MSDRPSFFTAYAYSPRENVGSRGGVHIITRDGVSIGRAVRKSNDALCKPASKFWGLTATMHGALLGWREATCAKCIALARRLPDEGATLPFDPFIREIYDSPKERR